MYLETKSINGLYIGDDILDCIIAFFRIRLLIALRGVYNVNTLFGYLLAIKMMG